MSATPISSLRPSADQLATLREAVARVAAARGPVLPFGIGPLDHLLSGGGLDGAGLHEFAGASASWSDDAAATLFTAGIAARFAAAPGVAALWALTRFDLYAPGLEQAGLGPDRILYAQGRTDKELLAMCEDALRDGSLACVVAEVKAADQTATRRLQLAASEGHILVKPTRPDIMTNLVINTSRRTYHMELRATPATYMAAVSWRYTRTIRRHQLREMVPLADSTIFEMERRGEFPRRYALSPRTVVWNLAEVEAWLADRRARPIGRAQQVDVRDRRNRPVKG